MDRKLIVLILFCLGYSLRTSAQSDAVYFYSANNECIKELLYQVDANPTYDMREVHFILNDSVDLILNMPLSESNTKTYEGSIAATISCNNKKISPATVQDINNHKRKAYLIEQTSAGNIASPISDIGYYIHTKEKVRYINSGYDFGYYLQAKSSEGQILAGGGAKTAVYTGKIKTKCKQIIKFQEVLADKSTEAMDFELIPDIGFLMATKKGYSKKLVQVDGKAMGELLAGLCTKNTSIYEGGVKNPIAFDIPAAGQAKHSVATADSKPGTPVAPAADTKTPRVHIAKKGQKLGDLIVLYPKVSLDSIVSWNELQTESFYEGQVIRLVAPAKNGNPAKAALAGKDPVATTVQTPATDDGVYTVKQGDNLYKVARSFGMTIYELKTMNNIQGDNVTPGQKLKVKTGTTSVVTPAVPAAPGNNVVVKAGPKTPVKESKAQNGVYIVKADKEDIFDIAEEFNVTVNDIISWNKLDDLELKKGQKLFVAEPSKNTPAPTPVPAKAPVAAKEEKKETGDPNFHIVKEGETIKMIAKQYKTTLSNIVDWNSLDDLDLVPGQKLRVTAPAPKEKKPAPVTPPAPANPQPAKPAVSDPTKVVVPSGDPTPVGVYVAKEGDDLFSVADRFKVKPDSLIAWNDLNSTMFNPGQQVFIERPVMNRPIKPVVLPDVKIIPAKKPAAPAAPATPGTTPTTNPVKEEKPAAAKTDPKPASEKKETGDNPAFVPQPGTYVVKKGDNVFSIARQTNISVADLCAMNNIKDNYIFVGQTLITDKKLFEENSSKPDASAPVYHVVDKGDTLFSIARKYGVTPESIRTLNNLKADGLSLKQQLRVK